MDEAKCEKAIKEYKEKEKELKEVNDEINFKFENMGMISKIAEKKRERIFREIDQIAEDGKKYCI